MAGAKLRALATNRSGLLLKYFEASLRQPAFRAEFTLARAIMAARRKDSSEIQTNAPGNPKPAGVKPDSVDVLVSSFLAELTGISSEMQLRDDSAGAASAQEMLPPAKRNEAFVSGSKPDSAGGEGKVEKPLSQSEHLRSFGSPAADEKNSGPAFPSAPAAEKEQAATVAASPPAAKPARADASLHTGEYEWKNLDDLQTTVVSQGEDRRRNKTFLVLPAAMLAIILGVLYLFQIDKKTPAPEATTQVPAGSVIQPGAASGGVVPRKEQGEPAAGSSKTETRPNSAAIQEQAAAKSRLKTAAPPNANRKIPRPDPSPVLQSERAGESAERISEALPRKIQEETRPQNDATAVLLPPVTSSPERAATGTGTPQAGRGEIQNAGPQADSAALEPTQNANASNAAAKPESPRAPTTPVVPSQVLVKVFPEYPTMARIQKVDGTVELEAYVNEKGDVVRADVVAGPTLLRAAAENALLKWKFRPASVNGVPVPSRSRVFIVFKWKSL